MLFTISRIRQLDKQVRALSKRIAINTEILDDIEDLYDMDTVDTLTIMLEEDNTRMAGKIKELKELIKREKEDVQ